MAFAASVHAAGPQPESGRVHTSALQAGGVYDQFIVKFSASHRGQSKRGESTRHHMLSDAGRVAGVDGVRELRTIATGAHVIRTGRGLRRAEAERFMRALAASGSIEYVEVDARQHRLLTPNDTHYGVQWGFNDADAGIRASEAWDLATGAGVVVAVVDTGITPHSDLNANVLPGYDFITDPWVSRDGDGRDADPSDAGDWNDDTECDTPTRDEDASDSSWHGTHVAGTVAALTNNAKGVAGTAFGARIVPVRVLGRCGGNLSDIANGIIWASGERVGTLPLNPNPAEVINLSLGGGGACGPTYQDAVNKAVAMGSIVVVAAGNEDADTATSRPANCDGVIAVASVTDTGERSSFSNYGSLIDVAAPGSRIASTINEGTTVPGAEGYAYNSGTSMAAPHVAGVVALVQSRATTPKTPAQMEALIRAAVRPFPATPSQPIGPGILDAKRAVDAAIDVPPTALSNGVARTGLSAATGNALAFTLAVPAGATNLRFVTSGGSGDADLYVKFGSAPTDSSFDCRSWGSTTAETCTISPVQAGTYHVRLKAHTAFSGVSLTGSYSTGVQTYSNTADFTISDNTTVNSPITVAGRSGIAPANASIAVDIRHTYQGDLKVDLVAPDGSLYNIHNRTGAGTANIIKTVSHNLSSEALNGTWRLRVTDSGAGDSGYINSWSITF
jgi:serine protease